MTCGYTILLLVVALLVTGVLWSSWRSHRMFCVPLPRAYRSRDSQETNWRRDYPEEMQKVALLLELVCEAFCFNPDHGYHFAPTDRIMGIYRAHYPRWQFWNFGDSMEIESLMTELNERFGVADDNWHANITLGELVKKMKPTAPGGTSRE